MHKGRLEAFSDGVMAILITIMVLEIKVPHGGELADLLPLGPVLLSYILSFVYIGIYWNNHHHLLQAAKQVNGHVLWANLHLLFWLSLIPFVTAWAGENQFAAMTVALYGFVLLMCGAAYTLLTMALISLHGRESALGTALGRDVKGKLSTMLYAIAIPLAFWRPVVAGVIYIAVAVMWFIPDPRIEKRIHPAGI